MSVETEFLHNSKKCTFREMTTDFENHQKHQDKTDLCAFSDVGLVGDSLQSLFSPFRNRKFSPISLTSGFHVKIKNKKKKKKKKNNKKKKKNNKKTIKLYL